MRRGSGGAGGEAGERHAGRRHPRPPHPPLRGTFSSRRRTAFAPCHRIEPRTRCRRTISPGQLAISVAMTIACLAATPTYPRPRQPSPYWPHVPPRTLQRKGRTGGAGQVTIRPPLIGSKEPGFTGLWTVPRDKLPPHTNADFPMDRPQCPRIVAHRI